VEEAAKELLDREIWVSWPHMVEAKVVAVRDAKRSFSLSHGEVVVNEVYERNRDEFFISAKGIAER
jgi:hypothetical protein